MMSKWLQMVTRLNLLPQPEEVGGATNTMASHKPLWANPISPRPNCLLIVLVFWGG